MQARNNILFSNEHFTLEVVIEGYTTSLQLKRKPDDKTPLIEFPLDALDRTMFTAISEEDLAALGEQASHATSVVNQILQDHLGGKEIVVVPQNVQMPQFVNAENDLKCKRFRQGTKEIITATTQDTLYEYADLMQELDAKLTGYVGMSQILPKIKAPAPYQALYKFLNQNAEFTPEKMAEYERGMRARFDNKFVTPFVLLNQAGEIIGVLRILAKGNYAYLSDETMLQEQVSDDKFPGATVAEKQKNKAKFLLAYLFNKACELALQKQENLIMIAANGRVDICESLGMQAFSHQTGKYKVLVSLEGVKPTLENIRTQLSTPDAQYSVAQTMGALRYGSPLRAPQQPPTPVFTPKTSAP